VYPNRGHDAASLEGSFGTGYNVGNGYEHGDSHGTNMGHQGVQGAPVYNEGFAYTEQQATAHIYGYDSVPVIDNVTWAATFDAVVAAYIGLVKGEITDANNDRIAYIQTVLNKRIDRLMEIHQDNLLKIQAPFDLQLDLLDREIEDVAAAQAYATEAADHYFLDLVGGTSPAGTAPVTPAYTWTGRMVSYRDDRLEALNREEELVNRTIDRAYDEGKPVDEVLYAMRLDWLQGVFVSGLVAYHDSTMYDLSVFDTEFDIFTYDMGHGKGHGHTNQDNRGIRQENTGFAVGVGNGGNDLDTLRGAPGPVDGKTRRYDRATLSGNGGNGMPSDHELGTIQAQADGAYGFN
jgi:hypothetical protein